MERFSFNAWQKKKANVALQVLPFFLIQLLESLCSSLFFLVVKNYDAMSMRLYIAKYIKNSPKFSRHSLSFWPPQGLMVCVCVSEVFLPDIIMTRKGPALLYVKIYHLALSTCCLNMAITTYVYIVCKVCSTWLMLVRTIIGGMAYW